MFFSADGPADPGCTELVTLHRSMNAPVVAIEDLPVGPARAAVALSRGGDASFDLTVAVRCERTGQVAYFTAGGELQELRSTSIAIDAALSFAESMGFLFDDEEVEIHGADGPRVAAKIWQRFLHGHAAETDVSEDLECGETSLDLEDELGPILSAVGPDLNLEPNREAPRGSGGAGPETARDSGELPFWLAISDEDVPRQSVRLAAPDPSSVAHHRVDDRRGDLAAPPEASPSEPENGDDPASRELLLTVLAETAVDRVCSAQSSPRPGLSKFRLKASDRNSHGASPSNPSPRDEPQPASAEVLDFRASGDDTNPPRAARYEAANRRQHLLLRLLSRF